MAGPAGYRSGQALGSAPDVHAFSCITVDGTSLLGDCAIMGPRAPTRRVFFAHDHHETRDLSTQSMGTGDADSVTRAGLATMDIGHRDNQGFQILRGAQDLISAGAQAVARWPSPRTLTLYDASTDGGVSGAAIVALARPANRTWPPIRRWPPACGR
ncbi:MAG TPA: hypothetical protein VFQ88_01665 [Nevskiaceae bacterium]|nr:hypothetical protein [Nevskiaceae bacterium]